MVDNIPPGNKLCALLVPLIICVILSIVSCTSCRFAKVKASASTSIIINGQTISAGSSVTQKYGLFSYYDSVLFESNVNVNEFYIGYQCYTYKDLDNFDETNSLQTAQAMGIITLVLLIISVVCVFHLMCSDFSPKIMILNQLLLLIALACNITASILPAQKDFIEPFNKYCDNGLDCKFSMEEGWVSYTTSILLIITLIFTFVLGCNKLPESDNDDVDEKVYREEEPDIDLQKEEESEIFVAEA